MKKILFALAALAFSTNARAGVGLTAWFGGPRDYTDPWAPSLDFRGEKLLVQVHALELVGNLLSKDVVLGADASGLLIRRSMGPEGVDGVMMLGGGFRTETNKDFDPILLHVLAEGRMGMEMTQAMGFGMYVVPMAGISNFSADNSFQITWGGGIQVSTWLARSAGNP